MSDPALEHTISAIREFSRFYTRRFGILDEHLLSSEFSLAEARILYELAQQSPASASELNLRLNLDPGYLSRLVAALHSRKLVDRRRSTIDGRRTEISLTEKGRKAFSELDRRSSAQAGKL